MKYDDVYYCYALESGLHPGDPTEPKPAAKVEGVSGPEGVYRVLMLQHGRMDDVFRSGLPVLKEAEFRAMVRAGRVLAPNMVKWHHKEFVVPGLVWKAVIESTAKEAAKAAAEKGAAAK